MGRVPPLAPQAPIIELNHKPLNTNIQGIMDNTNDKEKTVISFTKPTPIWATWIFRLVFWGSGFVLFTVCNDTRLPADLRLSVALYCTGLSQLVHIVTRAIGVKIEEDTFKPNNK